MPKPVSPPNQLCGIDGKELAETTAELGIINSAHSHIGTARVVNTYLRGLSQ
jgi:hypothetical protein